MSHTVEINNTILETTLETVDQLNANSKPVLALYDSLVAFGEFAGMNEITLVQDVGNPNLYTYRAEPKVGTVLDATWLFAGPDDNDPTVTATIDGWRLSVLGFGGIVRQQLIEIRLQAGLINFIVDFA